MNRPTPSVNISNREWSRHLTLNELVTIRHRFPNIPQAPLCTNAMIYARPGEPARISWACFCDQALLDALETIDHEPQAEHD